MGAKELGATMPNGSNRAEQEKVDAIFRAAKQAQNDATRAILAEALRSLQPKASQPQQPKPGVLPGRVTPQ